MKRRANQAKASNQLELSFYEVPPQPKNEAGSLDIAMNIREALVDTLGGAAGRGMDRHDVAAQISRLAHYDISKNMLDRYCAPSADGWRFPAEAIPALVVATGDYRLLEILAAACGCKVYRGQEAMLAEIGALTLQERTVKDRLAELRRTVPKSVLDRLVEEEAKRQGGRL
ncbi:phage regulatory CII family protein [Cupriavidus taiwanensis]|uniref:phage regulatory CII family protein n=1 Tax=Cupriavidus taiwanensis TaxID=164546 RepID=UPI000472A72F|nr:phage regulatory CII family protein [Cupriavidus taiwanensis]SOZ12049.1 Cytoplasmic protein [Cupriavidus taiwanensis]